jgi:hypothetical protein
MKLQGSARECKQDNTEGSRRSNRKVRNAMSATPHTSAGTEDDDPRKMPKAKRRANLNAGMECHPGVLMLGMLHLAIVSGAVHPRRNRKLVKSLLRLAATV